MWGCIALPPVISQITEPISKIQAPFDIPVCELSKHGVKFDLETSDAVTGQVKIGVLEQNVDVKSKQSQ